MCVSLLSYTTPWERPLCAREWWHSSSGGAARSATALHQKILKNLEKFKTSFFGVGVCGPFPEKNRTETAGKR